MTINRLQAVYLTVELKKKYIYILLCRESVCQSRDGSSEGKAGWEACEMNQQQRDWWAGQGQGCYGDIRNPFSSSVPGNSRKTIREKRQGRLRRRMRVKCTCGGKKKSSLKRSPRSIQLSNLLATRQSSVQWQGRVVNTGRTCCAPDKHD